MNVFRILGDLSHLLAMILLLGKIWRSKCCSGEGRPGRRGTGGGGAGPPGSPRPRGRVAAACPRGPGGGSRISVQGEDLGSPVLETVSAQLSCKENVKL